VKFLHLLRAGKHADMGLRGLELKNETPGPRAQPVTFHFDLAWYTAPRPTGGQSVAATDGR
jgi:hypothetical protein